MVPGYWYAAVVFCCRAAVLSASVMHNLDVPCAGGHA